MDRLFRIMLLLIALVLYQGLAFAYGQAYRFDRQWGGSGTGNGQFDAPTGLCLDGSKLYVTDEHNHRLQCFTLTGGYLGQTAAAALSYPWGVAVDDAHNVYVSDVGTDRLYKFNSSLALLGNAGGTGTAPGQFQSPLGVAYDSLHDRIVVTDRFSNHLSLWQKALTFIKEIDFTGARALEEPGGICYDNAGRSLITDTNHARVECYDASGVYVRTIAAGGSLAYPYSATFDPSGNVFIADTLHNRIVKTSRTGAILAVYGSNGSGPSQLSYPRSIVVGATGYVYVTDSGNDRVVRLKLNSAPTAPTTVKITPATPTDSNNLTAKASGSTDADADPIAYQYRWFRRATPTAPWVSLAFHKSVLPASYTSVGQRWKAQARAGDGDIHSAWVNSNTVYIAGVAAPGLTATAVATNSGAAITISLASPAAVRVAILNLAGRSIATLPTRTLPAGVSTLLWSGRTTTGTLAPRGQYLLRATATGADGSYTSATSSFSR